MWISLRGWITVVLRCFLVKLMWEMFPCTATMHTRGSFFCVLVGTVHTHSALFVAVVYQATELVKCKEHMLLCMVWQDTYFTYLICHYIQKWPLICSTYYTSLGFTFGRLLSKIQNKIQWIKKGYWERERFWWLATALPQVTGRTVKQ